MHALTIFPPLTQFFILVFYTKKLLVWLGISRKKVQCTIKRTISQKPRGKGSGILYFNSTNSGDQPGTSSARVLNKTNNFFSCQFIWSYADLHRCRENFRTPTLLFITSDFNLNPSKCSACNQINSITASNSSRSAICRNLSAVLSTCSCVGKLRWPAGFLAVALNQAQIVPTKCFQTITIHCTLISPLHCRPKTCFNSQLIIVRIAFSKIRCFLF